MKRSIILLLALTVALTLAAVPVSASPPIVADGHWTYVPEGEPEFKFAGPNEFTYAEDRGEWTGTFVGDTKEEFVVVCHPNKGFNFYKGVMTFTGTVLDESGVAQEGTMVIKTNGKQYSDTCLPGPDEWNGRWVITGGTEGLANVHGRGTFDGPSGSLNYHGQVHFS